MKKDSRRHCDKGVQSQSWRQEDALLGHQLRGFSIDHVSMLNAPNAALNGVADAFGRITVRCDQGTSHVFLARHVSELQVRDVSTFLLTVTVVIAWSSSFVNCKDSSLSVSEAMPPDVQTLMWLAPLRMLSLAAFKQSGTPSHSLPRAEDAIPLLLQQWLSLQTSVSSPCPPVCDNIRPPWNTRGPGIRNSSVALACAIVAPPVSRTLVNPFERMPRRVPADLKIAVS